MRVHTAAPLVVLALAALACSVSAQAGLTAKYVAIARVTGTSAQPGASGLAMIYVMSNSTAPANPATVLGYRFDLTLSGFPASSALSAHIHQWGDIASDTSAGAVFNPTTAAHGCAPTVPRQVGDLISTFTTLANGTFSEQIFVMDSNPSFAGLTSSIGRAFVIHAAADDCSADPDGNAGAVLAQGVVGVPNGVTTVPGLVPYANVTGQVFRADLRKTTAAGGLNVAGSVYFWFNDTANAVGVYARISGLVPGMSYGFHVHTFGDLTDLNGATSAGTHYDPFGTATHRMPYESPTTRHMGDMGNVIAQADGQVYVRQTYTLLRMSSLGASLANILGRAVVLHQLPDQGNFGGATGSAGARYAFGVIGVTQATALPEPDPAPWSSAVVRMYATNNATNATGIVRIVTDPSRAGTTFIVNLSGLPPNSAMSLHIRKFGDITDAYGMATGDHWNPMGWAHACPGVGGQSGYRAMGDLGNLVSSSTGTIVAQFTVDLVTLFGRNSVIGRSLVLWSSVDTCTQQSEPAFADGSPAAQGVIGIEYRQDNTAHNLNTYADVNSSVPIVYVAALAPTAGNAGAGGYVWIRQNAVTKSHVVYARMWGLAPHSTHGFHIHMWGDLTNADGTSAQGHLDFDGTSHALPAQSAVRHMGDMGNVQAREDGQVYFYTEFGNFSFAGTQNIVGRAVILHALPDQGQGSATGNAGARVLMGVIGIAGTPLPPIQQGPKGYATARLQPTAGNTAWGSVTFTLGYPDSNYTVLDFNIRGLAPSTVHGLHIRVNGDISSADGSATGPIWNPYPNPIGCAPTWARTMGLLGNIAADATGVARGQIKTPNMELFGDNSTIGHALTLSSAQDSCDSLTPAGTIISQGIIGVGRSLVAAYDQTSNTQQSTSATVLMATMQPTTGNEQYNGTVWFRQSQIWANRIEVYARFKGCVPGKLYGFHVHNFGDWSDMDGGAAGAHWNPAGAAATHALPDETWVQRLAGEMGNIMCSNDQQIYFNRHFDLMTIGGVQNIIGRGMILHGAVDQGTSQPPLSNFRVNLGIIGITAQSFPATYDVAPSASAFAVMYGTTNNPSASGWVKFTQQPYNATVRVEWSFTGLQQNGGTYTNLHSIHVHTYGDLTTNDGSNCGFHFNPYGWSHQCYPRGRHVGDLGNITQTAGGDSAGWFEVDLVTLFGQGSIIGRSVIVHQYWDDCTFTGVDSDCGNCGVRLLQGVIGVTAASTANTNYVAPAACTTGVCGNGAIAVLGNGAAQSSGILYVAPLISAPTTTLLVKGHFMGLPDGQHGVHIRQYGDVRAIDYLGTVYRPLANIQVSGGVGDFSFTTPIAGFPLSDLIGRSVVVSTTADAADGTAGGAPLIFGTIGLANGGPDQSDHGLNAASSLSAGAYTVICAVAVALMAFGAAQ